MLFQDSILEETNTWLAVNKPAGLIVEESPFEQNTIEVLVNHYLSKTKKQPYVGIVHRLDRVTSGVLLIAKKKSTLKQLNAQFEQRQIQKTYLAIVENNPTPQEGLLQHWLVKNQKEKRSYIHDKKVIDSTICSLNFKQIGQGSGLFLLEIQPNTGKFHQIRAQLAHIGCPVLGDTKYGATKQYFDRTIALHAWKLGFLNPEDEQPVHLVAPLPENKFWNFDV